jgi:hypothetical protein
VVSLAKHEDLKPWKTLEKFSVRQQFTPHNSPRTIHRSTIHREKIKISLDEFLILLDYC